MTGLWQATDFVAHVLIAGGGVLLAGFLLGRLTAAPARRQFAAAWAVRGAVVAAGLCLLPSWIALPEWVGRETPAAVAEPLPPAVEDVADEIADEWVLDLTEPTAVAAEVVAAPAAEVPPAEPPDAEATSMSWQDAVPVAVGGYLIVAAALLGQLIVGHVALWRLRRSASPAPPRVEEALDSLASEARLLDPPAVVVSDRIDAPLCFGVLRPTVVLPQRLAADASTDELRWVFAHELDHLRRGDPATAVWAGVARGLFFVWPWFWAVRRDLALSQEYLADAAAAAAGGRPADYAAFLVNLSDPAVPRRHDRSTSLLAAHAVRAGRSDLFRRVNMVLKSGVSDRVPRGWASLAAGGVMSAAVVLSGLGWAAADDDQPKPRVETKETPRPDADREPDAPRPPKPPTPPAPPRRDGDRREGERRDGGEDIGRLKRHIAEAMKDGRTDEAMRLLNELERAAMARRDEARERRPDGPGERGPVPPFPPGQYGFGVPFGQGGMPPREMSERVLNALRAQLDKLKDEPQAQDAVRRAIEQLRAEMERGERVREFRAAGPTGLFPSGEGGTRVFVRPMTGRLGVAVGQVPEAVYEQVELPKGTGILVMDVADKSAAEKAGMRRNDIIVRFAGKDVSNDERRFIEVVGATKPGEAIEVVILRKGKKETLSATLAEPPKPTRRADDDRRDRGSKSSMSMSVTVNDDEFDAKAKRGEVEYRVTGRVEDGRAVPGKITVSDDDKKNDYKSLKDVPEQHRDAVKQLLGSVSGR